MEVYCSFKDIVGGVCGIDPRDRNKKKAVIPVISCGSDISGHMKAFRIPDIHIEVELILARSSIFSEPTNLAELTICPRHRSTLGIGWRRGSERCRVPMQLSRHGEKTAKWAKAELGIGKNKSKIILKLTGVFVPVGSGEYIIILRDSTMESKIKLKYYLYF